MNTVEDVAESQNRFPQSSGRHPDEDDDLDFDDDVDFDDEDDDDQQVGLWATDIAFAQSETRTDCLGGDGLVVRAMVSDACSSCGVSCRNRVE